ncbi:MAG: PD-(D/E)XK nuclease family protein [Chloroflexota bacterium]|nr:PD-(D/E)XK nuclease family protein [Chloroflexota bacterium]
MIGKSGSGSGRVRFYAFPVYGLKKDDPPPLKLSPHSTMMFRECRQQYKFHYIDKLGAQFFRSKPYLTMGNHVHATLRDLFSMVPPEDRTKETTEKLLRHNWQKCRIGFKNEEDERRWGEKAMAQLECFLLQSDSSAIPYMVEKTIEVEITPGVILRGRIDRVDKETDGSLHIIDYKTGNPPEQVDWEQLYLYALMLSRRGSFTVKKASLYYLATGEVCTTLLDQDEIEQATWDLLVTAKEIRTERFFFATPGSGCRRCDFVSVCPAKNAGVTADSRNSIRPHYIERSSD